jgi:Tol biopolymer transport system component
VGWARVQLAGCALGLAAALSAFAAVVPASAEATLPGRNGRIAYGWSEGENTTEYAIHSVRASGKGSRFLYSGSDPAYSPRGRTLVFSAPNYEPEGLFVGRASRRARAKRLTRSLDYDPDYSRGGRIVFTRLGLDYQSREVWVYRHGRSHRIASGSDPAWSSRGRIAFVRGSMIYTMRPDGSNLRPVVSGSQPDWSPSGRRLVFVSRSNRLALVRPSGKGLKRLTRRGPYGSPTFSPDGRYVAFSRQVSLSGDVAVLRLRDRTIRGVPNTEQESIEGIDWQPLPRRRHR